LPFANADPTTEYLSDGITESLINSLSQLSQLKVMARTTAFRYKGKDADPQTVGHDLKIDAVLTGRVTRQGETLLIQVDLVNAADGAQLWGERYNQRISSIITVQEEIARQITERLRLRLTGGEQKQITKRHTENNVGTVLYFAGETDAALAQIRKTQEMDTNFVETYLHFGMVYPEKGMYAEAIAELNKAAPFSGAFASNVISLLGHNYALWGKRDEAIKRLDELKELSKRRYVPARDIAIIYTGLAEKELAFKWLRQACEERNGLIVFLKFDPLFKSLRTDPRFADLLQCVGLPQ
jgi:TolB-like protein